MRRSYSETIKAGHTVQEHKLPGDSMHGVNAKNSVLEQKVLATPSEI